MPENRYAEAHGRDPEHDEPRDAEPERHVESDHRDDNSNETGDGADEKSGHPEPIRLGQRILFVGMPGKGKSEGLLSLFAAHGGQRLLIDVQDHYTLGPAALAEDPPPLEVDRPRDIDWRHRTIRYVPRTGNKAEYDALHAAIFRQGNMLVCCDEAEDVAPSRMITPWVRKCVKQGRKVRITYGSATQRPVGVDRNLINQAEHAFVFPMVEPDDLRAISYRLGMTVRELADELNQLGQFEYLRHSTSSGEVLHMPPIPPAAIAQTRRHVINPEFSSR